MDRHTRTELVELIRRMQQGEGADDEVGHWIENLERATGNPNVLDMFHKDEYDGLSADEVFDKLCTYRPFLMPPPSA
jgi:hypothetical protein